MSEEEKVRGVTKGKCGRKKLEKEELAKCEVLGWQLEEERRRDESQRKVKE